MKPGYKQFKYLFTAELGQLLIKAGISCQVSATWKRSEESAKTDPVNFTNGAANFDQTLSLPVKMYLNEATQLYEEKKVVDHLFRASSRLHFTAPKAKRAQGQ